MRFSIVLGAGFALVGSAIETGCSEAPADPGSGLGTGAVGGGSSVASSGTAGSGTRGDGGAGGAIGAGAGPPADKVPVLVAQGKLGRTIVSCDDGETWIGNHSWDLDGDPLMCGIEQDVTCSQSTCSYLIGMECVQNTCCTVGPDAPAGIAFGNDTFATAWGHGVAGPIRTSTNGVDWVTRFMSPPTHVAFGAGRFVAAASPTTAWSTDGITWTKGGDTGSKSGVRTMGFVDYDGGRFVAVASAGGVGEPANVNRDIVVSADGGLTWTIASSVPSDCALGIGGGLVSGNGRVLMADQHGTVCTSTDGGQTWTVSATAQTTIAGSIVSGSNGVWTGSTFAFWNNKTMISSPDGVTWTAASLVNATQMGPVARTASGRFVTVLGAYANQKFMLSDDGVTWSALPTNAFVQSHPLHRIASGYVDPSPACPLPP